jgi:hypothetical protein
MSSWSSITGSGTGRHGNVVTAVVGEIHACGGVLLGWWPIGLHSGQTRRARLPYASRLFPAVAGSSAAPPCRYAPGTSRSRVSAHGAGRDPHVRVHQTALRSEACRITRSHLAIGDVGIFITRARAGAAGAGSSSLHGSGAGHLQRALTHKVSRAGGRGHGRGAWVFCGARAGGAGLAGIFMGHLTGRLVGLPR